MILVIGDCARRNNDAIERIKEECSLLGADVKVVIKTISPFSDESLNPSEHDLALVDENVISKGCSRFVLGSGLPVLAFGDVSSPGNMMGDAMGVLTSVVNETVSRGRLRDYIGVITERVEQTRQMILTLA